LGSHHFTLFGGFTFTPLAINWIPEIECWLDCATTTPEAGSLRPDGDAIGWEGRAAPTEASTKSAVIPLAEASCQRVKVIMSVIFLLHMRFYREIDEYANIGW
jgi:hypothetical protein